MIEISFVPCTNHAPRHQSKALQKLGEKRKRRPWRSSMRQTSANACTGERRCKQGVKGKIKKGYVRAYSNWAVIVFKMGSRNFFNGQL